MPSAIEQISLKVKNGGNNYAEAMKTSSYCIVSSNACGGEWGNGLLKRGAAACGTRSKCSQWTSCSICGTQLRQQRIRQKHPDAHFSWTESSGNGGRWGAVTRRWQGKIKVFR